MIFCVRAILLTSVTLFSIAAGGVEPHTCLDTTTPESTRESWGKMLSEADDETKGKLLTAVANLLAARLEANHVTSSLIWHATLSDPSPASVADQVSGLCARQLIALGDSVRQNQ